MTAEESKPDVVKEAREWKKDVPRNGDFYVAGWYFQRRLSNHARQIVEINSHGYIWRIGATNTKFVIDLRETGDYEWLGPVSPELLSALCDQVEQLRSLNSTQAQSIVEFQSQQRVMKEAIEAVDKWINDHFTQIPCTIPIGPITAKLRSAITPKGSECTSPTTSK